MIVTLLFFRYGGGPAVNHLYACATCQAEMEQLERRRREEMQTFIKVSVV